MITRSLLHNTQPYSKSLACTGTGTSCAYKCPSKDSARQVVTSTHKRPARLMLMRAHHCWEPSNGTLTPNTLLRMYVLRKIHNTKKSECIITEILVHSSVTHARLSTVMNEDFLLSALPSKCLLELRKITFRLSAVPHETSQRGTQAKLGKV